MEKLWGCQILYQDNSIVLCTQTFLRVQKEVILPAWRNKGAQQNASRVLHQTMGYKNLEWEIPHGCELCACPRLPSLKIIRACNSKLLLFLVYQNLPTVILLVPMSTAYLYFIWFKLANLNMLSCQVCYTMTSCFLVISHISEMEKIHSLFLQLLTHFKVPIGVYFISSSYQVIKLILFVYVS